MANCYVVVFIFIIINCNAQDINITSKSALVEGVLQKIFNLTLNSFSNLPIEERGEMMNKIEEKLMKSAQSLGPKSSKYVALIMEGIKSLTSENRKKWSINIDDIWDSNMNAMSDSLEKRVTNKKEEKSENDFIKNVANKIHLIANQALKHAKSPKEGEIILNNLKLQIIESAIRKQTMHNKQGVLKLNSAVVAQMVDKLMKENEKKNEARRMEFDFVKSFDVKKTAKALKNSQLIANVEGINPKGDQNRIEYTPKDFLPRVIEPSFNVTFKLPCHSENKIICKKIKSLQSITCNDKEISVQKLCDDIKDCSDSSDERNCTRQGVEKIRSASNIMTDIETSLSENCYPAKVDESLIAKQNEILRNILKKELEFIQKHTTNPYPKHSTRRKFYVETFDVRKTVNEVAIVIATLASALEDTVCTRRTDVDEAHKFNDIDDIVQKDFNKPLETTTWAPISCNCNEDICSGKCSDYCKHICTQRYTLGRWQCKSVSGMKTIPLDLICDGKIDCTDEADENGCSAVTGLAKFEAGNMYNLVLEMISTKLRSTNYESLRNKLINLHVLVEKLQKLSSIRNADVLEVKAAREACFSEMVEAYDQTKFYAVSMNEMYEIYVFLLSVNEKLVNAMKRSHIGNEKIIAPNKCFCRNSKCVLPMCSKNCVRACPAEPKLTRYFCGGSLASNISIPIEALCNGSKDCPGGDDEKDCSEGVCRKHHLVLLRHNLQEAIGGKVSSVREALRLWKTKVVATLRVMEFDDRPTRKVLQDMAKVMLHDLVMSYATLRNSRRSNGDDVIDQFYKVALVVMNTLKSCAK